MPVRTQYVCMHVWSTKGRLEGEKRKKKKNNVHDIADLIDGCETSVTRFMTIYPGLGKKLGQPRCDNLTRLRGDGVSNCQAHRSSRASGDCPSGARLTHGHCRGTNIAKGAASSPQGGERSIRRDKEFAARRGDEQDWGVGMNSEVLGLRELNRKSRREKRKSQELMDRDWDHPHVETRRDWGTGGLVD